MANIRLYVDHPLAGGQTVPLGRDAAHYLFSVMRLAPGSELRIFNGRDGEWEAVVQRAGKRDGDLACIRQSRPQEAPPDLWLLFAPVKKARTDFIVEKAVEMGAARIIPVQTEFTNSERIRQDRLQAHAVEAAEQCGATWVPEVAQLRRLDAVLADWPDDRRLMVCDEGRAGTPFALEGERGRPWAILVGPEGGLSPAERERLAAHPGVAAVPLGPRILRADTAAVAALALWQDRLGDWR